MFDSNVSENYRTQNSNTNVFIPGHEEKEEKGREDPEKKNNRARTGFHINIMRGLRAFLAGSLGGCTTGAEPLNCLFIRFGRREITIRPFSLTCP